MRIGRIPWQILCSEGERELRAEVEDLAEVRGGTDMPEGMGGELLRNEVFASGELERRGTVSLERSNLDFEEGSEGFEIDLEALREARERE